VRTELRLELGDSVTFAGEFALKTFLFLSGQHLRLGLDGPCFELHFESISL
jgi:hypothetical protein